MFIFKWDKRWEHSFAPGLRRELRDGSYERCWKTVFCILFLLNFYQYLASRRYLELSIWNHQLCKFGVSILHFPKRNTVDQAFSNHECNATTSNLHPVLGRDKSCPSSSSAYLPASHPSIWRKWWYDRVRKDRWRQKNCSHRRKHPPSGGILHPE